MPKRPFRFSLRSLLLMVALTALGAAALASATQTWLAVIASLSVAILFVGLTCAINTQAGTRAFWVGFVTWGLLYTVLVSLLWNGELRGSGRLMTTWALRAVYGRIAKEVPMPPSGGFPATTMWSPPLETFLEIGHLLSAWILAWAGGIAGQLTFVRFHARE